MIKKRLICTILASTMVLTTLFSGCKASKPAAVVDNKPLKPVDLTLDWWR